MSWHTLEWEYSQHEANPDDDEEGEAGDSWLPRISIPVWFLPRSPRECLGMQRHMMRNSSSPWLFLLKVFHDRKPFVGIWDMIMLALIGYTGIAVPYQVRPAP